jgi:Mrp family chromosome partitioning ATPase/capsular polysaccharide biosynthesis protein
VREFPAPGTSFDADRLGSPAEGQAGRSIFTFVRGHVFVVVFVTVLAVAAALGSSALREPTYEASAHVLVTPIPETERSLPQLPLLRASSDRTRVIQTAASDILAVTAQAGAREVAARLANEFARAAVEARGRLLAPIVAARIADLRRELRAQPDPSSPYALDIAERLASVRALRTADGDPTFSLTQRAEPSSSPVGPSRLLFLALSLFAGLVVGLGAALLADVLGPARVADAAEAVAATGLPLLARVPALPLWQRARESPLRFRPAAAPALRTLQHQLELDSTTPRRILFAGGSPRDGVTTSVAELGLTLARAGHDVLAVDLNARNPQLATRLGVPNVTTLSAILAAGDDWDAAIMSVRGAERLKLLAIGAHGSLGIPDEVAVELPPILAAARERFEYVLIDAPPLAVSAEALRIAWAVDAVVLVVRPNKTRRSELEAAVNLLRRADRVPHGLLAVGGRVAAPPADPAAVGLETERAPDATFVRQGVQT